MLELPRGDLDRLRPLVPAQHSAGHMAFVHAVLEGRMAGRAFVDDRSVPRTALVCNDAGFFFVLGEVDESSLRSFVPELLESHLAAEPTALWATSREWEALLDRLFLKRIVRKEFLRARSAALESPLPVELRLVRIDEQIAASFGRSLDPWVVRIWSGPSGFVERCFGWAILREDGEVVGFCSACAIGGGEAEVEVGTAPAFRRRGLATVSTLAFLEECQRRELRASWSCAADNRASERLARRLGFRPVRYVSGYPLAPGMEQVEGRWQVPARFVVRRRHRLRSEPR